MEYFDRVISLGQDCSVAGSLRTIKYKEYSYPFDWNITYLNFITDCFRTKFKNFETIFGKCTLCKIGKLCLHNNIHFYHDELKVTEELIQKYIKRGQRLHNLLNENKKILFIRKAEYESQKNICDLIDVILENYPTLDFKILLINRVVGDEDIDDKYTNYIIHRYKATECFTTYSSGRFKHRSIKKSYKCVYTELLNNIKSERFTQPPDRDLDPIND